MLKPERSNYSTLDLLGWSEAGALELAPKFQRRQVWTTPKKSYLIDTILRGLPVPPIYLRVRQNVARTKTLREVIDGQQRLRAVLEFVADDYALSGTLDADYAGKKFSKLSEPEKDQILNYGFICEVFQGLSDADVLEIFARVNSYSVQLNAQELRNGEYFGLFRQVVYRLAHEFLEFWRNNRIVSEQQIARMSEVELASELVIAQLHGMQDKKGSVDTYYEMYDAGFPERSKMSSRFRETLQAVSESFGEVLGELEFRRLPLFYTLYCVVYHRVYGLPDAGIESPEKRLTASERQSLRDAAVKLSAVIQDAKNGTFSERDKTFIIACSRQTDNIKPRQIRFGRLYKDAFS